MKIAALIARILLGLIFLVFGLNGFLHFIPMGPMPTGLAGQHIGALVQSHYIYFVAALQVAGGTLLLVGRYVPLALVILGPILVNILCFHFLIAHGGATPGLIATVLELFLIWAYRLSFRGQVNSALRACHKRGRAGGDAKGPYRNYDCD